RRLRALQGDRRSRHRHEKLHPERPPRPRGVPARVAMTPSILILDGARRLPRADILHRNREPGLYAQLTATQLGGLAIRATLEATEIDKALIGHPVMGMAQHSHRDSIYAAKGMAWRGGVPEDVPALTVARICGSGAEAVAVGAEMMLAGLRHDEARPFSV